MMNHQSKDGTPLWKKITIEVFPEKSQRPYTRVFKAAPGFGFTEEDVDKFLQQVSDELEKRLPGHEFGLAELQGGHFNFVWRGRREAKPGQEQPRA